MPVYERQIDSFDDVSAGELTIFEERPEPEAGELWSAIWQTTATKAAYDWMMEPDYEPDSAFDPDWKTLDPRYDHIFSELREAESLEEFRGIQAREDKIMESYDTIARSGFNGISYSLAAAVLDPITLPLWFVPITKGFQGAGIAGRMSRMVGYASADMAARETLLHHAQPSLNADNTMRTMLIGGSLAASFGALSGFATRGTSAAARKSVHKEAKFNAEVTHDAAVVARHQSAGAAAVGLVKASIAMEKPIKGAKWFQKISIKTPNTRLAFTPYEGLAEPAAIGSELAYTGVLKAKHRLNIADDYPPLDSMIRKERQTSEAYLMDELKRIRKDITNQNGEKLSIDELAKQVELAVVYGDDVIRHKQILPLVTAERKYRANMMKRMQRIGMVDKEKGLVKFNKYYGPRLYDNDAVRANTKGWIDGVTQGYKSRGDLRTDDELLSRALSAQQNVSLAVKTGQAASYGMGRQPARLKSITLEIDDDFIEPFLIRDVRKARDSLIRNLEPEIQLRERYGNVTRTDTGFSVESLNKRLKTEYEAKRKKLIKAEKFEQAEKLTKVYERSVKDIQHLLKKISGLGEFNTIMTPKIAGFLNEVRAYAGSSWLGNSMIASLHEPTRTALEHGFGPMFRANKLTAFPKKPTKQFVEQMRAFDVGLELRTHGSTAILRAEIDDPGMLPKGIGSMAQRYFAPAMYKYNGQNWFNQTFKTGAATTHGDQLVRYAMGTQATKKGSVEYEMSMTRFAQVGMGKAEMNRLARMVKDNHTKEIEGVHFLDLDGFTDRAIAEKVGNSMMMVADSTIVTPGAGALPIMLDNQLGRMLTQFRNVFFNMQGKTIMPVAQRIAHGDMRAVRGLTAMLGQAWLIYQIRFAGRVGYDPDKIKAEWAKQNIQDHIREALERSGMTGLTFEMFSALDNLAEGNFSRMIGLNEGSRYFYRRTMGLGQMVPGVSWLEKVGRGSIGSGLSKQGFTQADANALGYALPLRTVFYLDPIMDKIQEAAVSTLPDSDQRKRNYRDKSLRY